MFEIYGKLAWFFKEHWRRYTWAIGLLALVNVVGMLPPKLVGLTIDEIHRQTLSNSAWLWIIAILFSITIGMYLIGICWQSGLYGGAGILEKSLRYRLVDHFLRMTPSFYEKYRTGDLMARSTNDLKAIALTAGFGILSLTDSILYTGLIIGMMGFTISWKLTLLTIIPLPVMAYLMKIYGKRLHAHFESAQSAFGRMNDSVLESVNGIRVIRAYVQEGQSENRFAGMTDDVYRKNLKVAAVDSLFDPTINILVGISYLIGLGCGAKMVFEQTMTLGDLVAFNVYLGMLIWPMFAIGELMNLMQRGNASLDRVQEILDNEEDVSDTEADLAHEAKPGDMRAERFVFRYPSSKEVNLWDIAFKLKAGGTMGIVGKTGSGKTTLIRQLLREYPLERGGYDHLRKVT